MDYLTDIRHEYGISLRVIRVELSPGSFENLITNLPDRESDLDELKELYHLRWNEENAYRDIKYPRFSKKPDRLYRHALLTTVIIPIGTLFISRCLPLILSGCFTAQYP